MADYNINAVTRRVVYSGSAGVGPYAFSFEVLAATDIAVYKNSTKLSLTTNYTVTINTNGTGSVTLTSAATSSDTITIIGARAIERTTDFVTAGDLLAASLNEQLDSQIVMIQQIAEENKRTLKAPQYDPASVDDGGTLNMVMPVATSRANKTLAFDSSGNPVAGPTATEVSNAQTYANNAAASAAASAASATTSSTKASESAASAAAALVSQNAAASSASSASSSSSSASSSASSASGSASTATTKAAESAASAALANDWATKTSSPVAGGEYSAKYHAQAAATSASNASSSASSASTSASNASTSASNAASSASAASASQVAAAASAAAAAASYDSFDDRYLGTKTSDPTLDNDGNALVTGALYYNSVSGGMKVYDGANWIAASSAGTASLLTYRYIATAGQTTFSGTDAGGSSMSYSTGNIIVMRNGAVLDASDYTATSGTSVVLAAAAVAGDIINVIAFKSFTVAAIDAANITSGLLAAARIGDGSLSGAKITDTTLAVGKINATGTPSSSNYLRGDGSWQTLTQAQRQAQLFTASGSWTAPAGVTKVRALVVGGGGGARNSSTPAGNGGIAIGEYTVSPGTAYTITVGPAGTGSNTAPTAGSTSSFGAFCSATGGAAAPATGTAADGVGSSGTLRNSNVWFVTPSPFDGFVQKDSDTNFNPRAFDISAIWRPGARGSYNICGANWANGGVGGIVYLEWVA